MLTTTQITASKPMDKPKRYSDRDGLMIEVTAAGSKSWIQRLSLNGKRRTIGLGSFPAVSLATARKRAADNLQLTADGRAPKTGKDYRSKRAASTKRNTPTFGQMWDRYYGGNVDAWADSTAANTRIKYEKYIAPHFADVAIDKIDSAWILDILEPIQLTSPENCRRVKQIMRKVFAVSVGRRVMGQNPTSDIELALPKPGKRYGHFPAIPYQQMPEVVQTIASCSASQPTRAAILFMIFNALRGAESRLAHWGDLDLDENLYVVSADVLKQRRVFRVPLSQVSIDLIDTMRPYADVEDPHAPVFPSIGGRTGDGFLHRNTFSYRFRHLGLPGNPHGCRSAFRDWAAETTPYEWDVIELALSHQPGSSAERAYYRSDQLEARRELMEEWSDFLHSAA